MDREVVACGYNVDDRLDVAEVNFRVDALCVQVQRKVDKVDIAGSLSVAKQTTFDSISTSEDTELRGGDTSACKSTQTLRKEVAPIVCLPRSL